MFKPFKPSARIQGHQIRAIDAPGNALQSTIPGSPLLTCFLSGPRHRLWTSAAGRPDGTQTTPRVSAAAPLPTAGNLAFKPCACRPPRGTRAAPPTDLSHREGSCLSGEHPSTAAASEQKETALECSSLGGPACCHVGVSRNLITSGQTRRRRLQQEDKSLATGDWVGRDGTYGGSWMSASDIRLESC